MGMRFFSLLFISIGTVGSLLADDAAYDALIQQLDSAKFSERRAAAQELRDFGKDAFDTLRKAASSSSTEVTSRSIEILKHHLDSEDPSTKQEAKVALESLAESKNEMAARLAYRALNPRQEEEPTEQPGGGIGLGPIQIQMRVQAAGNNRQKMQIKMQNGVKEVEIEEGDRKIKIQEDANGIKVEITEKVDGKEETKKFEAKDAIELQQKHPKAFKEYSKLKNVGGGIQIQGGGGIQIRPGGRIQIQGNILPVPGPNAPNGVQPLQQPLQNIERQIEKYKAKIANGDPNAEHYQRVIESLEKHRKQIAESIKRIEQLQNGKQPDQDADDQPDTLKELRPDEA